MDIVEGALMNISEHFTLKEFINSSKADELGIDNTPNAIQISAIQELCDNILEPIRFHFKRPIRILSGFRSVDLNKAVGGAATSQHTLGEAADIEINGIRNDAIWSFIVNTLNFDQCIAEKLMADNGAAGWIHISHKRSGAQRKEALSFLGNGKYVSGLHYMKG